MNRYTELHNRLLSFEKRKPPLAKWGNSLITTGGIAFCLSLAVLIAYLVGGSDYYACGTFAWLSTIIGGIILGLGIALKILGRAEIKKLAASANDVQARLVPLEEKREEFLARIRAGDFAALEFVRDYVLEKHPTELMPLSDALQFRPQKGETCFIQIGGVPLGRRKSRTVTRKTGGGYRIAGVYVPVQKKRVQVVEMNTLDNGTLAITTRRILYLGSTRKLTTKLDKILELEAYQDALAVTKEGRQSADFFLETDGELLAAILDGIEGKV